MNIIPFTVEDAKAALQWGTGEIVTRCGISAEIISWDNREEYPDAYDGGVLSITAIVTGMELYYTVEERFRPEGKKTSGIF